MHFVLVSNNVSPEYVLVLVLDKDGMQCPRVIHVQPLVLGESDSVSIKATIGHTRGRTYTKDAVQLRDRSVRAGQVVYVRP